MQNQLRIITSLVSLSVLLFLFTGCSKHYPTHVQESLEKYNNLELPGLKIGLIADSQIQTEKSSQWVPLIAGKMEDVVVPVAKRPPALNFYSKDLLRYFLDQLILKKVDIILYLGDAANNGCKDEINDVLFILEEVRDDSNVPIFFVIGNHDYLGGGNTPFMQDRQALCDSARSELDSDLNKPLTKYDLMLRVHGFNIASGNISHEWKYDTNFDRKKLFRLCINKSNGETDDSKMLHQHRKPGCFLAGRVFNRHLELDLLLLDTSDYSDKEITYNIERLRKGYFGISGWVSTQESNEIESQLGWFLQNKKKSDSPTARVVASHYPRKDLAPFFRNIFPNKGLPCRLSPLFDPQPEIGNFWFSAHTHDTTRKSKLVLPGDSCNVENDLTIHMLNIGSTSDSKKIKQGIEEPHAVVATIPMRKNIKYIDPIGIEIINTSQLKSECKKIFSVILRLDC